MNNLINGVFASTNPKPGAFNKCRFCLGKYYLAILYSTTIRHLVDLAVLVHTDPYASVFSLYGQNHNRINIICQRFNVLNAIVAVHAQTLRPRTCPWINRSICRGGHKGLLIDILEFLCKAIYYGEL